MANGHAPRVLPARSEARLLMFGGGLGAGEPAGRSGQGLSPREGGLALHGSLDPGPRLLGSSSRLGQGLLLMLLLPLLGGGSRGRMRGPLLNEGFL